MTGGRGLPLGSVSLLLPPRGVVATTAGGGGRLRERDFPPEEGEVEVGVVGEVKEEVLGRGWAEGEVKEEVLGRGWAEGEVKEEERGRGPREGEGEGERGEVKANCGGSLLPAGEKRATGGSFVLWGEGQREMNEGVEKR